MVQIQIPASKQKQCKNGRYTVYCIELFISGRCHKIDRRYSEFYELHRKLKKYFPHHQLPSLPPKKMRNLSQKLIEQRRTSLEDYLKNLLRNIELNKSKELNEFLNLPLISSANSSVSNLSSHKLDSQHHKFLFRSFITTSDDDEQQATDYRDFNYHQCMIGFKNELPMDSDLASYLASNSNSVYSDSSSNKSNCETESSSSASTSSSTSGSLSENKLSDILVIGSLNAIYDRKF